MLIQKLEPVAYRCENHKIGEHHANAQPVPCKEPDAFVCGLCGLRLCGAHAGGHYHVEPEPQAAVEPPAPAESLQIAPPAEDHEDEV